MSRKKSNKRKKPSVKQPKKKSKKKIIIISVIAAVLIIGAVIFCIFYNSNQPIDRSQLCDSVWTPNSATDASGDEVELSEVYNVDYTAYTGSLSFKEDGTFSLWLSPGDPEDGTHSGEYTVVDDSTLDAYFDDGTYTSFKVNQANGNIISIIINYNDYDVVFTINEG
ncbi:MAG: hypothetical protein LUF33_04115 [Clostridiales bacterium]|nr:hypothetical protein [Clostridiales bacterium]